MRLGFVRTVVSGVRGKRTAAIIAAGGLAWSLFVEGGARESVLRPSVFTTHCETSRATEFTEFTEFTEPYQEPYTKRQVSKVILLDGKEFELLGCGVRRVTFLRVAVYIASIYIGRQSPKIVTSDLESVIKDPRIELAIRIEPLRDTNGPHLRKGFLQRLTVEIQDILNNHKKGTGSPFTVEGAMEANEAIPKLQEILSQSLIRAGQSLTFIKRRNSEYLTVNFDGKIIGQVNSSALSQMFLWVYLNPENPISQPVSLQRLANVYRQCTAPLRTFFFLGTTSAHRESSLTLTDFCFQITSSRC